MTTRERSRRSIDSSTVYPDSIEVLFYQGVSRMLAGDDAGAIAPLEAAARLRQRDVR